MGRALVARFSASSRLIVASYCRHQSALPTSGCQGLFLDLTRDDSITEFASQATSLAGSIDTVVLAAGRVPGRTLSQYEFGEIDQILAVNFTGQAKVLKALLPALSPTAHVLLVSSIAAQKGSYDPIYAAAKGAALSLVKSMAASVSSGVRVNALAPGLIEGSGMFQDMAPERREWHRAAIPSKRFVTVDEVASVIVDISQDHWASLNGACIDLNGGQYQR